MIKMLNEHELEQIVGGIFKGMTLAEIFDHHADTPLPPFLDSVTYLGTGADGQSYYFVQPTGCLIKVARNAHEMMAIVFQNLSAGQPITFKGLFGCDDPALHFGIGG